MQTFYSDAQLRIHCLQLWFDLSEGAAEDALHNVLPFRQFTDIRKYVSDRTTIMNFRYFLEKHHAGEQVLTRINDKLKKVGLMLRHGVIIDATIISAPCSIKINLVSETRKCTRLVRKISGTLV